MEPILAILQIVYIAIDQNVVLNAYEFCVNLYFFEIKDCRHNDAYHFDYFDRGTIKVL